MGVFLLACDPNRPPWKTALWWRDIHQGLENGEKQRYPSRTDAGHPVQTRLSRHTGLTPFASAGVSGRGAEAPGGKPLLPPPTTPQSTRGGWGGLRWPAPLRCPSPAPPLGLRARRQHGAAGSGRLGRTAPGQRLRPLVLWGAPRGAPSRPPASCQDCGPSARAARLPPAKPLTSPWDFKGPSPGTAPAAGSPCTSWLRSAEGARAAATPPPAASPPPPPPPLRRPPPPPGYPAHLHSSPAIGHARAQGGSPPPPPPPRLRPLLPALRGAEGSGRAPRFCGAEEKGPHRVRAEGPASGEPPGPPVPSPKPLTSSSPHDGDARNKRPSVCRPRPGCCLPCWGGFWAWQGSKRPGCHWRRPREERLWSDKAAGKQKCPLAVWPGLGPAGPGPAPPAGLRRGPGLLPDLPGAKPSPSVPSVAAFFLGSSWRGWALLVFAIDFCPRLSPKDGSSTSWIKMPSLRFARESLLFKHRSDTRGQDGFNHLEMSIIKSDHGK